MDPPHDSSSNASLGDMPTHPMRVKVLYTFDTDSKTTCLARLTETLHIPVVAVDEASQVGVISLQRCLESITSASPELLSALTTGDYAIYAYDYSEPETPLVGQGMLSAAITQTSNQTAMITGRVCQNVAAIFSNGVKETLEVKLRLVPVKNVLGLNNASNGSSSPRSNSFATSGGFDPNAWNNAMLQGRSPQTIGDVMDAPLTLGSQEKEQSIIDEIFGLDDGGNAAESLSEMGRVHTMSNTTLDDSPAFSTHFNSAPGSRVGSPVTSREGFSGDHIRHNSFSVQNTTTADHNRPSSRASNRSTYHGQSGPQNNVHGINHDEYQDEDGQARKRAKITQTDWRGRSSFGGRSGNLRVTAATTASMQMHRPVATRPASIGHDLEPPPRVPTPVPQASLGPRTFARSSLGSRSLLRQASTMSSEFLSDADNMSDAIASSPEDGSPGQSVAEGPTPPDIPSSPPVFPGIDQSRPLSPAQSTTKDWRNADSGYMSERIRPEDSNSNACSPDFDEAQQNFGNPQPSRPFFKREASFMQNAADNFPYDALTSDLGFDNDLPQPDAFGFEQSVESVAGNHSHRPAQPQSHRSEMPSRAHSPMPNFAGPSSRRGSLALPTLAPAGAQHAGAKKRQSSQQPRSIYHESEAGSPAPSEIDGRPLGPRRSGSGAHRRKIIEHRLHTAIAKGEMPQYCSHCGAIETPTWRRLYVKYVDGKPTPLDSVEGEGETVGVEPIEWDDESGECTRFIVRKSMKKTKDCQPGKGFSDIQLCNPCGLWFSKTRKMRPQDKWGRRSGTRKSKKTAMRNAEAGEMTDGIEPQSEAFFTDGFMPEDVYDDMPTVETEADGSGSQQSSRSRSVSGEAAQTGDDGHWHVRNFRPTSGRTTRSSPAQFNGTQDSPIELDDKTPRPTRRLLFPSPRQTGETKTLDNADLSALHTHPSTIKTIAIGTDDAMLKNPLAQGQTDFTVFKAVAIDKENMPPTEEPDLSELLASPSRLFKTPQKTPVRRSPRSLAKQDNAALLLSPTPTRSKRKVLSDRDNNAASGGKPKTHDFMTSPASSRYFLRSTPTRLANTPGRSSRIGGSAGKVSSDVSPFSRQLAEMLASDGMAFNSPNAALAFADLPPFPSPTGQHIDWENLDSVMSSDFATQAEKSDLQNADGL